jgi:hypothetical protein
MMSSHRRWSALGAFILGGVLVLVGGGLAAADTDLGQSGQVGPHHLRDSKILGAGVACVYAFDGTFNRLTSIVVRPPFAEAKDIKPTRDVRQIYWRIKVQARAAHATGPWKTIRHTSSQDARGYDDTPAPFVKRTLPMSLGGKRSIRVSIDLAWANVGGNGILGEAHNRVDIYAMSGSMGTIAPLHGSCDSRYAPI